MSEHFSPSGGFRRQVISLTVIAAAISAIAMLAGAFGNAPAASPHYGSPHLVASQQSGGAAVSAVVSGTPASVAVGDTFTFSIAATNHGGAPVSLKAEANELSRSAAVRLSSQGCEPLLQLERCELGSVAPGATSTVSITFRATATGTLDFTAAVRLVAPQEPVVAEGSARVVVTPTSTTPPPTSAPPTTTPPPSPAPPPTTAPSPPAPPPPPAPVANPQNQMPQFTG